MITDPPDPAQAVALPTPRVPQTTPRVPQTRSRRVGSLLRPLTPLPRVGRRAQHPVPLDLVFRRRTKDEQAASSTVTAEPVDRRRGPEAPKGRPTPKRSEAQSNRRARATVPADRKAAQKQAREARRIEHAKQREALAGGDERYLPLRDKGPVRRLCRDFIDSRFHFAEWFLPLALAILVLSLFRNAGLQSITLLLWLLVIVLIVGQSFFTAFRLRKLLNQRFPNENLRGAVAYGLMRTLQMRRMRLPKPQVKRGEKV